MITLALIGNGRWGKKYLEVVKNIQGCNIKYVKTHDYKDLLSYNDIDGIIIATPAETHAEIIKSFPKHYLLVEKPLTTSYQDALKIKNKKIMVGHTYLYNLAYLAMKKKIGKRKICSIDFNIFNTSSYGAKSILWELCPHLVSVYLDLRGEFEHSACASNENAVSIVFSNYGEDSLFCRWDATEKSRMLGIKLENDLCVFTDAEDQKISALENEVRAFIKFIKTGITKTGLSHAIEVIRIIDILEKESLAKKLCQ